MHTNLTVEQYISTMKYQSKLNIDLSTSFCRGKKGMKNKNTYRILPLFLLVILNSCRMI